MKITDYIYDRYERGARLYPAILTTFPILLLINFYSSTALVNFFNSIGAMVVGDLSLSLVFIFLLVEVNKFFSKEIIQKHYFKDEQKFPTTNILLFADSTFSEDYKIKVHNKIHTNFGIKLLSKNEEERNEKLARQKINEAVALIREKVKAGRFVQNENIHYGFWRNLIGGSFVALPISITDAIFFVNLPHHRTATVLSVVSLSVFLILLISSKYILATTGKNYAKTLIKEYLLS